MSKTSIIFSLLFSYFSTSISEDSRFLWMSFLIIFMSITLMATDWSEWNAIYLWGRCGLWRPGWSSLYRCFDWVDRNSHRSFFGRRHLNPLASCYNGKLVIIFILKAYISHEWLFKEATRQICIMDKVCANEICFKQITNHISNCLKYQCYLVGCLYIIWTQQ